MNLLHFKVDENPEDEVVTSYCHFRYFGKFTSWECKAVEPGSHMF